MRSLPESLRSDRKFIHTISENVFTFLLRQHNMVTIDEMISRAMSFPEVSHTPHFEKESFRVKKKIFATLDTKKQRAVVKLSPIDQSVFSAYDPDVIFPVAGGWGKQGWTVIELRKVRKTMFKDALQTAYRTVAPKSLSAQLDVPKK